MAIFFCYMIGAPVLGPQGQRLGKLVDLAIRQSEDHIPRVVSVAVKLAAGLAIVDLSDVAHFDQRHMQLRGDLSHDYMKELPDERLFLKRDLLDAQVVDTDGVKVVRVNDILLTRLGETVFVTGLDIGPWGLMRRMGMALAFDRLVRLARLKVPEGVIAWDTVEPIDKDATRVRLRVSQDRLVRMHPADLADVIEEIGFDQRTKLFEELSDEQLADLIEESSPAMQSSIINELDPERAADILEEMEPDDAADLLGEMSSTEVQRLLNLMEPEEAADVERLLAFDDDTAGAMMTTSYVAVDIGMTVGEALAYFREEESDAEVVAYFYLLDLDRHLVGVVSVRRLLLEQNLLTPMAELAGRSLFRAHTAMSRREVVDMIARYGLTALPVVDDTSKLVGVITVHDVLDGLLPNRET
jgi:magnesium transporter